MPGRIEIIEAYKHNLKKISLTIPKNKLIVITGVSGSGKSTLAFDTIFLEGQRRYLESLSSYARQYVKYIEKADVKMIKGIAPTIAIEQNQANYLAQSTIGTIAEITPFIRLLFARKGEAHCPICTRKIVKQTPETIVDQITKSLSSEIVQIYSLIVKNRRGDYTQLLHKYMLKGFIQVLLDGQKLYIEELKGMNRNQRHTIALLVDALPVSSDRNSRFLEALNIAFNLGDGEIIVETQNQKKIFSRRLYCPECNFSLSEPQPATFSPTTAIGACPDCQGNGVSGNNGAICTHCLGTGFNREALSFKIDRYNIHELLGLDVGKLYVFFKKFAQNNSNDLICQTILPNILHRLRIMVDLHLDYLSLNRKINSVSGGEFQRARLVSQIGQKMSGVIYVLDEPSIGMHPLEQQSLITQLKELSRNNTVIVVEHDEETIWAADHIVDLGPGAGDKGGQIIFNGSKKEFEKTTNSLTADYLFKRKKIIEVRIRRQAKDFLRIKKLSANNIKELDLEIPLNCLVGICGVSGSGKSSLIANGIYPLIKNALGEKVEQSLPECGRIDLPSSIKEIFLVDQKSIGKNSRSCLATYLNIMPVLRQIFALLPASRIKGFKSGHFSYNNSAGYCQACRGMGTKVIPMGFLPDLETICPICEGRRFNNEVLKIHYRGFSISDILNLTVEKAEEFFGSYRFLQKKFALLKEIGLGYLKLGQTSTQFSGGESQRLKLCRKLGQTGKSGVIYLFDEPSIGLHPEDIKKFIKLTDILLSEGNSVIIIEHNLDLLASADYLIELGPGSGDQGGRIVFADSFEQMLKTGNSKTVKLIKKRIADVF